MAKEADIRGKVTPELKQQFTEVLAAIGLTPSVAINIFAHQVVNTGGLPFRPTMKRQLNSETLQAIEDLENGHNVIHHNSVVEMFAEWDKELSND
jgi:DNA-damage-inducible protein J